MRNKYERKNSPVSRVVSPVEGLDTVIGASLEAQRVAYRGALKGIERAKRPEIARIIEDLNVRLERFLAFWGGKFMPVPPEDIHIVTPNSIKWPATVREAQIDRSTGLPVHPNGSFDTVTLSILIYREDQTEQQWIAETILHEMIHVNSFNSFQVGLKDRVGSQKGELLKSDGTTAGTAYVRARRTGLATQAEETGKLESVLVSVDEAITEELKIRFMDMHFRFMPDLREEYEKSLDLLYEMDDRGLLGTELGLTSTFAEAKTVAGSGQISLREHAYQKERAQFKKLILDIFHKDTGLSERERTPDGIFDIFARAKLSGELLPLARMLDRVYGKKALRRLDEIMMSLE